LQYLHDDAGVEGGGATGAFLPRHDNGLFVDHRDRPIDRVSADGTVNAAVMWFIYLSVHGVLMTSPIKTLES
jgi:hypothetical protein